MNKNNPSANWTVSAGSGRDLQLVGGGRVMVGKPNGWDEYRLTDGGLVAGQHGFSGVQDSYRLPDGTTMLATVSGGGIVLRMVTAAGQVQRMITYPGHSYVRLVRPTASGTFLVTSDTLIFEGDDQGHEVASIPVAGGQHVWKAMRLPNGNTVVTTGYGATLQIYSPARLLLQTVGGSGQPNAAAIAPWFYADFHQMPTGNYFVVNSQADRTMNNSVQLLEYDAAGMLVWQQKQPTGVRSVEAAIVLDGLDVTKLYVETEGRLIQVP